jgi:hypothetical protein
MREKHIATGISTPMPTFPEDTDGLRNDWLADRDLNLPVDRQMQETQGVAATVQGGHVFVGIEGDPAHSTTAPDFPNRRDCVGWLAARALRIAPPARDQVVESLVLQV